MIASADQKSIAPAFMGERLACPTFPSIEDLVSPRSAGAAGSSPAPQARARSGRLEAAVTVEHPRRRPSILFCGAAVVLLASGIVCTTNARSAQATNPPAPMPSRARLADFITEASQRFGVPSGWIMAVMRFESAFDPRARSPKGAMGLMQLMPDTWAAMRAGLSLGNDPYDPHDNTLAGAGYLRALYDRFGADGFLAAYNAGPGRYLDYVVRGRALPPETRRYVAVLAPAIGEAPAGPPFVGGASAAPLPSIRETLFVPVVGAANAAAIGSPPPEPAPVAQLKPAHGPRDGLFAGAWSQAQP